MTEQLTLETLRNAVQGALRAALAKRDPQQPFTASELLAIHEIGRSKLADELHHIDQIMPAVEAEAEDGQQALLSAPLSADLRQFIHEVYERGSPPWIRIRA